MADSNEPDWLRWYGRVPATLAYPKTTLYEALAAAAARTPDRVAWDFADTTSSYRHMLAMIDRCADALADLGLRRGERLLIAMPTMPQAVIAFYAANKLGAVAALVHPLSTSAELERYLDMTGARMVLTLDALYGPFASVRPKTPVEVLILARIPDYLSPTKSVGFWLTRGWRIARVPAADRRVRWWATLMKVGHPPAPRSIGATDDPAAIMFSGGTTGTPKGIVLSNRNLIATGLQAAAWGEVRAGESMLAILPIFHGFGFGVCINAMLLAGGKSILVPAFSARIVAKLIGRKRPNILVGVPTLYDALTRDRSLLRTDLGCLRLAFSGADSLPRSVKERFEQAVAQRGGDVRLLEGYGLTEAVSAVIVMPCHEYREGSIGVPLPDMLAMICKPGTEEELPAGEMGEICLAGPSVMLCYLNDPEATSDTLRPHSEGRLWLHTGDLGMRDAEGFFYFKDRMKRMIKSSGFNVFPRQVEAVLHEHPLVLQACVVGVPDPSQVERVKAFVVLRNQLRAGGGTEQELIEYCRSRLIKWSCPREITFVSDLPETRLGKVDYKALISEEIARQTKNELPEQKREHGGDRVAGALRAAHIECLFTLCGGHISPILTAARESGIRVVDVRQEATAVFAADAQARLTGAPGAAVVTAGPGVTNTITALKNAQLAQSPVILLGGAAPTALQGRGALQDIDQRAALMPHVKLVRRVRRVRDLEPAVADASRIACTGVQGPVFVECPIDVLYPEDPVRSWYAAGADNGTSVLSALLRWYLQRHVTRLFAGGNQPSAAAKARRPVAAAAPPEARIAAAAKKLARASRPLILIGSQTLSAGADVTRIARAVSQLGAPVFLSGLARGLLGRDHDLQMRHQRRQALRESDCIVVARVPCDFRLDYGRQIRRSSVLIAANRSRKEAHLNRRPDIAAIGDAGLFLEQLGARADGWSERWQTWTGQLRERDTGREREIEQRAGIEGEFVNPLALLLAIERGAGDRAIFVADGGDFVATASYVVRPRGPRAWLDPGVFGTLGVGAGFALAAATCRPGAEVWLLYGDGACGYGLAEFDTFVRHGIPVIAVVGNDAGWTQIAREQVKLLKDNVGTVLARTAYHEVAAAFGAEGILVKSNGELTGALTRARAVAAAGKPVLVNAWLDRTDFREGSISM